MSESKQGKLQISGVDWTLSIDVVYIIGGFHHIGFYVWLLGLSFQDRGL